jgi:hypothetical protein
MTTHHIIRAKDIGFQSFTNAVRTTMSNADICNALTTHAMHRVKVGDIITVVGNNGQAVKRPQIACAKYPDTTYLHYPQGELVPVTCTTLMPDEFPITHWDSVNESMIEGHPPGLLVKLSATTVVLDETYTGKININGHDWDVYYPSSSLRIWYINEKIADGTLCLRRKANDGNRLKLTRTNGGSL